MRITELFTAQSIALDEALTDQEQIISRLVELQATHGNITDKDAYKKALYAREAEGSTYVDNGITVPHAKTDVVTRPSLAALRLSTPVQYNAEDDGTTDLLFAIAAPENGSLHVDMLARMMQMLMNEEFVEQLRTAIMCGQPVPQSLMPLMSVAPARPWNVLAITFTNKAAGELKERLKAMLGDTMGGDVFASTFHSACVRILRRDAERIGFPKSFTIYDSDDQQRVIKQIYKELMIDDKFLPVKSAISQISGYKDKLLSAKDVAAEAPRDTKAALISKIYTAYSNRLRTAGAMDFDDLIFHTVQMLKTDAEAREYYQQKFRYVVVDEYQDTSVAQFHLVRLLAGGSNNVCVVGDDDQSIYKFRGATIENILNFEKVFAGAKTIRLEQNYRSTSNILNAANSVIKNNNGRKGKTLWTQNGDGDKVHHYTAASEQDEASHVAEVIGQNLKNGASLKDHAVLYRMNAQSNPIETYFARAGIPYRIVGGQRFFDRKEVKDINSYMAVVVNPRDDVRLRRIINEPARKIGATTIDKIGELAAANGVPMMEIIREASSYPALGRAASALNAFYSMYRELCDLSVTLPLDEFAGEVIRKTGYEAMLKAQKEEGETRLENLGQLISSVKTYAEQNGEDATLSGFLEEVALIADLDSYDEDADSVTLMTMHSAKGLEFPYVFICGMNEGIFPSRKTRTVNGMEEERRLAFVAMTRAEKALYITEAGGANLDGSPRYPSRFILDIDRDKLEFDSPVDEQLMKETMVYVGRSTAFLQEDKDETTMEAGTRVRHPVFGPGTIVEVDGSAHAYLIKFDSMPTMRQISFHARLFKL